MQTVYGPLRPVRHVDYRVALSVRYTRFSVRLTDDPIFPLSSVPAITPLHCTGVDCLAGLWD
jgi:hypothetical protein